eukprot:354040-Chlamydomonas_euryale.AAC.3
MSGGGTSGKGQPPGSHMYDLYGVLVHHGHSVHSGHYIAYVRNAVGMWHLCDDDRVAQVGGGADRMLYAVWEVWVRGRNAGGT